MTAALVLSNIGGKWKKTKKLVFSDCPLMATRQADNEVCWSVSVQAL